jgi:HlyD family secretion protein
MIRKYLLTLLAIAGFAFATYTVFAQTQPMPVAPPVAQPSKAPYRAYVAGSGIVEASTRNIAIGTHLPGIIVEVFVEAGDAVKAGDSLFRLDSRDREAQLQVEQAAVAAARANLERLLAQPRPEEVPAFDARVAEAAASVEDLRSQLAMWEAVQDPRALSRQELDRRRFAVQMAEARLQQATAELNDLKAGAWEPDIAIARAQVLSAEARARQIQTELERLVVKSPVDGEVLQVNVRAGEFAPAGVVATPLMLVGGVEILHVRADVDENDAWRVRAGANATAFIRGNNKLSTAITFVRFEPYVVPKRSLTGESTERVDTRVLQVIFKFPRTALPVYVGQLMDVFIEAEPISE